ncbi:hypothetical protein J416_13816 [Gracilibacillus halophilus YIM-C55.5]|uniref:Mini-ribonuclease 3 n=1 Tax=Gracilibacillus halophilus YIM-C55.5 TaxID=1308866 RepID=N4WRP6_9BACI|nr:ribonuclease III domain-containing protein [Gracilibacillus halophilus]ENH95876.1 hypothetical protein J416_13816 [Gracilibacillus halophilus YIM-C55.5]
MKPDVKQMKSVTLAYMGDAVYEKHVREHLISQGKVKVKQLHQSAVRFVNAEAQAAVIHEWIEHGQLSNEELAVVRRGRNAKAGSVPKHTTVQAYRYSTAFEALMGFLYLAGQHQRLESLIHRAIDHIEKGASDIE